MTEYIYPESFQRKLLAVLIRRPQEVKGLIESEYFTNPTHQDLAKIALASGRLSKTTLLTMTKAFLDKKKDLWSLYRREVRLLYQIKLVDLPALVTAAKEFAKHYKFSTGVEQIVKDVGNRKYETLFKVASKLKSSGALSEEDGLEYKAEPLSGSRWKEDRENIIETWYFKLLDKSMGGGLAAGELAVILAGGKAGKSTLLARIAAGAMWQGKKVALASGELSAFKYRKRIDAMLTGIPYQDLFRCREGKSGTKAQMAYNMKHMSGNIYIKDFPSGKARIQDISNWLDRLIDKNYTPDILVVDYLALFKPNDHFEERRMQLGNAAVDLRALAVERKISTWSAAQANRAALSKPLLGPADLAEDFSLFWTVDFLIAFCQTDQERGTPKERLAGKTEKCRFLMAASRDTAGAVTIAAEIDRSKFTIKEKGYWEPPKGLLK